MPLWIVIGVAAAVFVLVIVLAATFNVFSADAAEETETEWNELGDTFTADDLRRLSFRPALRGYRMDDVDRAVERMRLRIDELEAGSSRDEPAHDASTHDAAPHDDAARDDARPDHTPQAHGQ